MPAQLALFPSDDEPGELLWASSEGSESESLDELFPGSYRYTRRELGAGEREALEIRQLRRRLPDGSKPRPLPRTLEQRAVVEGLSRWLAPVFAGGCCCAFTGTYSDDYGQRHGLMLARNVIKDYRAFLRHVGRGTEPGCIGVERHPSGRDVLHLHALAGGDWSEAEIRSLQAEWVAFRGWASARKITNEAGAVAYCVKHMLKQRAEDHFDFWTPPAEYGSRYERRRARAGKPSALSD